MARNITAFAEKITIAVDNAKANVQLRETEQRLEKIAGASKNFLGAFSSEAKEGIEKLEGLTGSVGQFTGALGLTAGPMGIFAGGLASATGVATGLGIALFKVADESAEMGNKIFEATEKTALGARTISAFAVAGKEVGLTVEDVSTGLSKFTVNMGLAADGTQKNSKALAANFAKMGIDVKKGIEDPDAALATFVKHFADLPDEQSRLTAASEIFGRRFGSSLVAMFNEVGGDLDGFTHKLEEMGLIIDDTTARESHEFEKLKKDLETQFGAMARTIGFETIPAFQTLFVEIGAGMDANKARWKQWGEDIALTILSTEVALGGFKNYITSFNWQNMVPGYGLYKGARDWYQGAQNAAGPLADQYSLAKNPPDSGGSLLEGAPKWMKKKSPFDADAADSPPKRLGRAASQSMDPLQKFRDVIERINRQMDFYGDKTELAKVKQELMAAGLGQLTGKLKEQAEELSSFALKRAAQIDLNKQEAEAAQLREQAYFEIGNRIGDFLRQQQAELDQLNGVQKTATDLVNEFIKREQLALYPMRALEAAQLRERATLIDLNKEWQNLFNTMDQLDKDAGDFVHHDKFGAAKEPILAAAAAAAAASKGWKIEPPREALPKWQEFFRTGLQSALMDINGMLPQQQPGKKRSLFGKILGFAAPFLSLLPIPGAGFLSMAAGAASSALQGDIGGGAMTVASGIQNKVWRTGSSPGGHEAPSHAMGLSYVPFDNYVARLHRGEGVLTAAANANRGGGGLHPQLVERLTAALERWESAPPGHIATMVARQLPDELGRNASLNRKMQVNLGLT